MAPCQESILPTNFCFFLSLQKSREMRSLTHKHVVKAGETILSQYQLQFGTIITRSIFSKIFMKDAS